MRTEIKHLVRLPGVSAILNHKAFKEAIFLETMEKIKVLPCVKCTHLNGQERYGAVVATVNESIVVKFFGDLITKLGSRDPLASTRDHMVSMNYEYVNFEFFHEQRTVAYGQNLCTQDFEP